MLKTIMQRRYLIKFAIRIGIFIAALAAYLTNKNFLYRFMTHKFTFGITTYGINALHILWAVFMLMMIRHLIPRDPVTMALRKSRADDYVEVPGYDEFELLKYVQDQNRKAWIVMLIWLCFNAVFGILYLFHIIDEADLLMLTIFYFLSDYICILIFCPFQTLVMKNKCCVNCRIYDWGHFMMFTPMLFIQNFFSWSLFFTSVIVLIHWELVYAKHPRRFWEGSNASLKCANCKDKTCLVKNKVNGQDRKKATV